MDDVFSSLFREPPLPGARRQPIRAYLLRSAYLSCTAVLRAQGGPPLTGGRADASDSEGLSPITSLPIEERIPVALVHHGGLTYSQAADVVGSGRSHVLDLLRRGLGHLAG